MRHRRRIREDEEALRTRLRRLAEDQRGSTVAPGYRRLHVLLRREVGRINRKRVYRLYREEGLARRHRVAQGSRRGADGEQTGSRHGSAEKPGV